MIGPSPQHQESKPDALRAFEVNFDALVGPTHHYGGLSRGNVASQRHGGETSNPKHAALQGLKKMKLLTDLGITQALLPPHERPDLSTLRSLGFTGKDGEVLEKAFQEEPGLLEACSSASAMWAANAATVSPGPDTKDGRLHITPANLVSQFHRSLEPPFTERMLRKIFGHGGPCVVHEPLPSGPYFGDEGAANHTRLCRTHGEPGVEIFVYGRSAERGRTEPTKKFPARQSLEASRAVARLHQLSSRAAVFIQQNPRAIDGGVFHNDVISVGNQNVFLFHEQAFVDTHRAVEDMRRVYGRQCEDDLIAIEIKASEVSLEEAVASYLFNSQLVTMADNTMSMICAKECEGSESARTCMERILDGANPIRAVLYAEVRQSMKNGGGPACLRLRVVLSGDEPAAIHQGVLLTGGLYEQLVNWVEKHYRDQLRPQDLADPRLLDESRTALDELSQILQLGSIYPFQQA